MRRKFVIIAAICAATAAVPSTAAEETCVVGVMVTDNTIPISYVENGDGRMAVMSCVEAIAWAEILNSHPNNGNDVPGGAYAQAWVVSEGES